MGDKMTGSKTPTSFSEDGHYMAYSGSDGGLRVVETASGNPIADFTDAKLTITCVKWSHGRHLKSQSASDHSPQKKKRKKSDVAVAVGDLGLIAMGTTGGTVFLYSFARGQLHTLLENGHTAEVTDLCWHPNGTSLFTCSQDGQVVEWDVPASQVKQKWRVSDSVHSLCLWGSDHLLTADRAIKLWHLPTKKVVQKFTGHATEVFRLLPVPSSGAEGGQSDGSYFVSAAANDKIVNAWLCHGDSRQRNAVASFSVTEEPAELTLQVTSDQMLILAVLTTKGKVLVFQHTLGGKLLKPVKPTTVVHAVTEGSRDQVPVPVPLLAAWPSAVGSPSACLLLAHGSLVTPQFSSVSLQPSQPEIPLVVSQPERKAMRADYSLVKTPEVSGSTVLYPSHIGPAGPNTEPSTRRKRNKSVSELTVAERLEAMGVAGQPQSAGSGRPPKTDQLVIQLTQGLQSNDAKLLTNAFQERNPTIVHNTVKKLPLPLIHPLIKELVKRRYCHPQTGRVMNRWLQQIFCVHKAFISTVPDIVETLRELEQYITYRTHALHHRMKVETKLSAMLARGALQKQVKEEPLPSSEPVLVYKYESSSESDEGDQAEMEASDPEGNLDDSDAD
ncbi:hypothetical protein ACOMHN_058685 [Nucella lapillus]